MLDFFITASRSTKRGTVEIYPKFLIKRSSDLMIRGGDFYAVWIEEKGLWSCDEQDALQLIDKELDAYAEKYRKNFDGSVKVLHMWDAESGMIDSWHKYCQRQMRDSFVMLDEKLIFSNMLVSKTDYASRRLDYPLEEGDLTAYNKLMSTLYSEEERRKIEWAIGAIVTGDSKKIQKFMVLYGAVGTGKSTVINIIEKLFAGYFTVFDAKSLGSSSNSFALEAFKSNPLIAIQHDGDLSRLEDNTRINSLVSHELMTVNEKFKSAYSNRFKCFLIMGTNKPVRITDAKSGLIRRLIDVTPSGNKLPPEEYRKTVKQIDFELGAIAYHCKAVYEENRDLYDDYIPTAMLGASNDFYNFVEDSYYIFKNDDSTTLKASWEMYKTYCDEAKVPYPLSLRLFREELKNYFREFAERVTLPDGTRVRNYYKGFRTSKFGDETEENMEKPEPEEKASWLSFGCEKSLLDDILADAPAQYAGDNGAPLKKWQNVTSTLSQLDTSKLHYVKVPENHIVIDFDIPGEGGGKDLNANISEAAKFPPTYAELSKSGGGVHLHYIYKGDVTKLSRIYSDHIEVKVYSGNSSLRRRLTKCNDIPVAAISSGLPVKGDKKMLDRDVIKTERGLRTLIRRNLNKEIHPGTKPSMDFIKKILDDAFESGLHYDISDMRSAILAFAANSTHQSDYCLKLMNDMHFRSEDISDSYDKSDGEITFYDVEVFPNLFIVCFKHEGEGKKVVRMINPTPAEIESLLRMKLVGFNCRRYDNHILYARLMGYTNEQLYTLSKRIISGVRGCFFGEAYNLSYTDVLDFSSKKQSLKKFEIELGIHHQELGLPWDEPVPESMWEKVASYCDNDVIATEAVFNARKADFTARKILAKVAGMSVNDTTNSLTTRIIFGKNRTPQSSFNYRFMGCEESDDYTVFDDKGRPLFPGYRFEGGKSTYRGEEIGEGGYVYAEPGMYGNVALLDIASMHPSSIVAENLFGDEYTGRFKDILDARIAIKHKDFDKARTMLGGALSEFLDDESTAADLAQALKIAINSVYGLTDAGFENPFRDVRNKDNIVAKRGALFMVNLKHEVQARGFTVAHIKTDSIKIPDATPEIISFVMEYGKRYGYTFEHEATYDRMCLVNNAVYIARVAPAGSTHADIVEDTDTVPAPNEMHDAGDEAALTKSSKCVSGAAACRWTATGTQFQIPYVFKKLFSHEPILFEDKCETKSVTSSALYLDMNEALPDVSGAEKALDKYLKTCKANGEVPSPDRLEDFSKQIAKGHNYIFVGRVGSFCPIKPGKGGGVIYREKDGKYYAVGGSKGYRWLESEMVKMLGKEQDIDESYYTSLVDGAIDTISKYGDYEWFVSDEPYVPPMYQDGQPIYLEDLSV